jgi:hypothetical protein
MFSKSKSKISVKEKGYAIVPVLGAVLALGAATAVVVPMATSHPQAVTQANVQPQAVAPAVAPQAVQAPAQAPAINAPVDMSAFGSKSVAEAPIAAAPAVAPEAAPSALNKSPQQNLGLVNGNLPMFAKMSATKTATGINVDMTYTSGSEPLVPEIYLQVASFKCADGSTRDGNSTLAYGQWMGFNSKAVILKDAYAGCDVTGFTLTKITPDAGLPVNTYWTPNINVAVDFVS